MKKSHFFCQLFFVVFFVSAQRNLFELKLKHKEVYRRNFEQNFIIDMGNRSLVALKTGGVIQYKVMEVMEGYYKLNIAYDSLYISTNLPGNQMMVLNSDSINHSNEKFKLFSLVLGELKAKEFTAKLSKSGEFFDVLGFENILENVANNLKLASNQELDKIVFTIHSYFGSQSFIDKHQMLVFDSRNKIKKGKVWSQKKSIGSLDSLIVHTKFEAIEKNKNFVFIEGKSKVEFKEKDANSSKLSGDMKSRFKIDRKTGWVLQSEFNQMVSSTVPNHFSEQNHGKPEADDVYSILMQRLFVLSFKEISVN